MNIRHTINTYWRLGLNILAVIAIGRLLFYHFEFGGIVTIIGIAFMTFAGYQLGKLTCHLHKQRRGILITIGLFSILNLLHSMIDGALVGGVLSKTEIIAVLSHELARQPALYIILWGMLSPFSSFRKTRLFTVPILVSGVWILGTLLGQYSAHVFERFSVLELVADLSVFLFLGDIIHHLIEEYRKLRHPDECCHN